MGYISVGLACADLVLFHWEKKLATEPYAEYSFHLTNLPSRLTFFHGKKGSLVLDSSYNAAPYSVRAILDTAYFLRAECYPSYKILVVLGDMRELGTFSQAEHRKIAAPLSMIADKIVLVGQETKKYTRDELVKIGYAESSIFHFGTSILARDFVLGFLDQDDHRWLIVVKGSQNTIFLEDVVV
jgi:UDP-N-acetylmuramyl pentapeptide synthase